jgi:hypothetical protein
MHREQSPSLVEKAQQGPQAANDSGAQDKSGDTHH